MREGGQGRNRGTEEMKEGKRERGDVTGMVGGRERSE